MARINKLLKRARRLGIEDDVMALLETLVEAAEDSADQYEDNRGYDVDTASVIYLPEMPLSVWTLGELAQIEYDRIEDGELVRRYHAFEDERPLLTVGSQDQRLWLAGGDYTVTSRGIVG